MQVEALRRNRQPFRKTARETGLSRATVARVAKAKGLRRLANLDPIHQPKIGSRLISL
ncbi:MAG: hypothetical protein WBF43_05245 [Methylocella sp.]